MRFKKKALLMVLFMAMLFITGCKEKRFSDLGGMAISMSEDMRVVKNRNATWAMTNGYINAVGIRTDSDDLEKTGLEVNSLSDYVAAYIKGNDIPDNVTVNTEDNYIYFTYNNKESKLTYVNFFYDNRDYYWLVSFACPMGNTYDLYRKDIFKWADSVKFTDN